MLNEIMKNLKRFLIALISVMFHMIYFSTILMDNLKTILSALLNYLRTLSLPLRILAILLMAGLILIMTVSCGTTKVSARVSENAASTVTVTTTFTPKVDVSPNVEVQFNKPSDN